MANPALRCNAWARWSAAAAAAAAAVSGLAASPARFFFRTRGRVASGRSVRAEISLLESGWGLTPRGIRGGGAACLYIFGFACLHA